MSARSRTAAVAWHYTADGPRLQARPGV